MSGEEEYVCNLNEASLEKAKKEYVCNLNEASLEKAKKELNEDPKERQGAVDTFRQWIVQQPHISCPTDTAWLLRYLRVSKFSQLVARQKLCNFLTSKSQFPKWYNNIDTRDAALQAVLDTGYIVPLPGTDLEGRKIILGREGRVDTSGKVYTFSTMMRASLAVLFYLLNDENNQVNGFVYLTDLSGFSVKHQAFYGYDGLVNGTKCFDGNMPSRFKGIYIYNPGPIIDAVLAICKPAMSRKTLSRMHMFGDNLEKVYKAVPQSMLPDEYLPDDYEGPSAGSHRALVENLKKELTRESVRQRVLADTKTEYGIDKKKTASGEPQASFRKLNIE